MGKQKKSKDKKDKKKNKDRDRSREKQRKDKKKREKKRSYSSSSSSQDSSDSSSSSREKSKKKDNKIKKRDKKETKPKTKSTNNPYDFDKTVSKPVPGFPVGLPSPGFNVPLIHATPPPPITAVSTALKKTKAEEINIFKLLPKLPYGVVLFGKTLYSTEFIHEKAYNKLLKEMTEQIQGCVKQTSSKKATSIASKLETELQKIMNVEEQRKKIENSIENSSKTFLAHQEGSNQELNRFTNIKNVYQQSFQV